MKDPLDEARRASERVRHATYKLDRETIEFEKAIEDVRRVRSVLVDLIDTEKREVLYERLDAILDSPQRDPTRFFTLEGGGNDAGSMRQK